MTYDSGPDNIRLFPAGADSTGAGYYSSFVVKIWVGDDQGLVRGYIQHVSTREGMHFLTIDRMLDFMKGHLKSSSEPVETGREGRTSDLCGGVGL